MTKTMTDAQIVAHKRRLKADAMKRFRALRTTLALTPEEMQMAARGLKMLAKEGRLTDEGRINAEQLAVRLTPRK
jgi:hypothetical protein